MANEATEEAVLGTPPGDAAEIVDIVEEAAQEAGASVELIPEVMEDAYTQLLGGRPEEHDRILLAGIEKLSTLGVNVIVLAQVSMARILPKASTVTSIPVLSSLSTSLQALRNLQA